MKLIRFGEAGKEKPGIQLESGKRIDVSSFCEDYNENFFAKTEEFKKQLQEEKDNCPEVKENTRLGAPLTRPSKIICVGLNYSEHANESKMDLPQEPVLFFKATSSVAGPNDNLILPKGSEKTDWEVELGVVIGKKASYVKKEDAMDYVFGYVLHNDYSEREFQLEREGQWVKGKSCDTFAPLGPYLVSKNEISDPHQLRLWLKVNDEMKQDSNTSYLIFNIPQLVSYISQFMTLLPGDVISTGTPNGVGLGLSPQQYLKEGDVVELGIDGLGVAKQTVKSYENQ